MQLLYGHDFFYTKLILVFVLLVALIKLFFFMRIFEKFAPLIKMLMRVVGDISVFLVLFFLVLIIQGLMLAIVITYTDPVYYSAGSFATNYLVLLRLALANFDFSPLNEKTSTPHQHYIFWAVWFFCIYLTMLIFLNFIIAEVSESYVKVKDNLVALTYYEKS